LPKRVKFALPRLPQPIAVDAIVPGNAVNDRRSNLDLRVVADFGREWSRFDQSQLTKPESEAIFDLYFGIFPWSELPDHSIGADIGCGTGRWALGVAPRVGTLHCVDAACDALESARNMLRLQRNCVIHHASIDSLPFDDSSLDFAYCLGVLHHLRDPEQGLREIVNKVREGGLILVYYYYRFDNRPRWFRALWKATDTLRRIVASSSPWIKYLAAETLAYAVYMPLARAALLLEKMGANVDNIPLSQYRHRSLYVMRTDALDRFGTRVEHRLSRNELQSMMERAGLSGIVVSDGPPYWTALGRKARTDLGRVNP
jgi:SAM-dependent methyltransferase